MRLLFRCFNQDFDSKEKQFSHAAKLSATNLAGFGCARSPQDGLSRGDAQEGSAGSFAGKTWEFGQLQSKAPLGFAFKATAIGGSRLERAKRGAACPETAKAGGAQPGQCSTCCRSLKLL